MSILTIAQNVAMATGFSSPASVVGSADELAIQLLALIKEETRALSDRFRWQKLVKRGTFPFVSGTEAYVLPSDFKDFIPGTIWNYTAGRPLIAPVSPIDFEIQKNSLISSGIDKMVYVYGNEIHISPTPTTTDTINYEYTSLNIYATSGGTGKAAITLDTDVTTVRENLVEIGTKLRFLVAKALINHMELQHSYEALDYEAQIQRAILTDGFGHKKLNMSGGSSPWWKGAYTSDGTWPSVAY